MDGMVKNKWVGALRSSDYEQGRQQLCDGERFCALGVLCDTLGLGFSVLSDGRRAYRDRDGYRDSRVFPMHVSEEIGLAGIEISDIAKMNDEGRTFGEIADYIEREL